MTAIVSGMAIVGVHHVQITIPTGAEDEAREFYCSAVGLTEIEKPEALRGRGGLWLRAGGAQLHVGTEDGIDRSASKAHVGYEVDDLDALRARLVSRGISATDGVSIPGVRRFEIRDPFGNRLEFLQRT